MQDSPNRHSATCACACRERGLGARRFGRNRAGAKQNDTRARGGEAARLSGGRGAISDFRELIDGHVVELGERLELVVARL
eukprot:510650-Pleurochrysis_carterae.AAC.1